MIATIITLVVILALAFFLISIYNRLAKSKVLTEEGWSGIGTFLQQRNDLIPNLVEVVKGFAGHENKTLTDVIKARNESISALTPEAQIEAAKHVSQAMLNLKVLTEQYPQLQANQNFLHLQDQLGGIEEKSIKVAGIITAPFASTINCGSCSLIFWSQTRWDLKPPFSFRKMKAHAPLHR